MGCVGKEAQFVCTVVWPVFRGGVCPRIRVVCPFHLLVVHVSGCGGAWVEISVGEVGEDADCGEVGCIQVAASGLGVFYGGGEAYGGGGGWFVTVVVSTCRKAKGKQTYNPNIRLCMHTVSFLWAVLGHVGNETIEEYQTFFINFLGF